MLKMNLKLLLKNFFEFEIDTMLQSRTQGITIFYSIDDYSDVLKTVEILEKKIENVKVVTFENKGHFDSVDLEHGEFPELLQEVLK